MAYYTERHGMRRPVAKTYDISIEKYALLLHCCEKYYNNLAWKYPAQCPDGHGCCGIDFEQLRLDLQYEIPTLYRDYSENIAVPTVHHNVFDSDDEESEYDQYALLDLIEFFAENVRDVVVGSFHSYFGHYHLTCQNSRNVCAQFRDEINDIFRKTGLLYELNTDLQVERIVENSSLTPAVESAIAAVKEAGARELLQEAILLHRSPYPADIRDAVEKLWDAYERLKTYYCGFTGTPVDETIAVFGDVVDSYTMKESSDDGITVRIAYEPRLARVILSDEQAKEIQKYYDRCAEQGSTQEQIEESQRAMAQMRAILGHPDRLKKLAADIVLHYEALCAEKPEIVQKAMIVCSDRAVAFRLLQEILAVRPEWGEKHRAEDESALTEEQLDKLMPLPKINLVATQGANDKKDLFDACGTKEYRKMLDRQFKDNNSNFKIAVVVDMWITGFDVPSLAVMYIDKPLQKHTLIQTISRVNRVFDGKDKGLVVDYIGIKNDMLEAVKKYGSPQESPVDELNITLGIFRNHLALIDELLVGFNATKFYVGEPLERLNCLNMAAEYVQSNKEMETRFMGLSRRLKGAYTICFPSGELTDVETTKAQFYLAIRSIIYKQTKGDAPDAEIMNRVVEEMVRNAIACTGIENIVDENKSVDLFSDEFIAELDAVKMPITKFNALLKLLRKAISSYGRTNKVKAQEFDERLRNVVEAYNSRDKLVFTSEVVADFVNDLSDQLLQILKDLQDDKTSFEKLGISFEEKAFYDILVKVRDDHGFPYADEKCLVLAKKIKELVDDKAQFADWSTRDDIKNQLNMELTVLLYQNGYPPEWDEEVFEKVMEQAENFKKYSDK